MNSLNHTLDSDHCQKARLSRDSRFDGLFFTAVKTTGIYCRSICPATPPKESNVTYFRTPMEAAVAGFRPCLRCRPDSAPNSSAWLGSQALFKRAIRLIDQGALENQSLSEFSTYLGISDRYLRQLFIKNIGIAPKPYALYQQCLFAKQLIHQTQLPIKEIALASGFNSVRRFNDCFIKLIKLTPSEIRRRSTHIRSHELVLKLNYRPPYDWAHMQKFLSIRVLPGLESISNNSYGRTIQVGKSLGHFKAIHMADEHAFKVSIHLPDYQNLRLVINNIRRILDLDADTAVIEAHLKPSLPDHFTMRKGLRLPGIWQLFEAGIRAILGQQVSVQAAKNLLILFIEKLGKHIDGRYHFPTPDAVLSSDLSFLKMPGSRKMCIKNLAQHVIDNPNETNIDPWLELKGIGPWTINYTKMRGLSDPDVFLTGDSGINQALTMMKDTDEFNPNLAAPWRSYLTFQLWSQL